MGDGQIPYVVDHEVKAIHDTLINAGIEEKNVKFAFVIVNKRINTKFIQKVGGNHTNPPSGTVVDDVVTLPERYDFFLISQSVTRHRQPHQLQRGQGKIVHLLLPCT